MPIILAIDQGCTKTDALIADHNGSILGIGNDRDMPFGKTIDIIETNLPRTRYAAEQAVTAAGLTLEAVDAVSASCTGADWPYEYEIGLLRLREALAIEQITLYNDCIGALRGGTELLGRDCAVICLGTGCNIAVSNRDGDAFIYGYYIKERHQGASAIGSLLFETVFDAEVGLVSETALTRLLLDATGYSNAEELHMAVTAGRTDKEPRWEPVYKDYCPLLFDAVHLGDSVAVALLERYCEELAHYVAVAAKRLFMVDRSFDVVLSGGVSKGGSAMRDCLEQHLTRLLPGARCVEARFEPVVGALLLEYDRLYPDGIPVQVMATLEKDCRQLGLTRDRKEYNGLREMI